MGILNDELNRIHHEMAKIADKYFGEGEKMPTIDKPIWNTGLINNGKMEQVYELAIVRHGHWVETDDGDCCYKCSECGFLRDAYILDVGNYCPHCGAQMDKERKEK